MNPCIAFLRRVLLKTDALLCDLFDPLVQGVKEMPDRCPVTINVKLERKMFSR